jgi:hypothetical protein
VVHSRFKKAVALIGLWLLSGCATQAQREFQTMRTGQHEAVAEFGACGAAIYNAPESAPIRAHIPLNLNDVTLQQLSDPSYATPEETQVMFSTHPKIQLCRKSFLAKLTQAEPAVVPIRIASFNKSDDNRIAVAQRKITWGEYIHRMRDLSAETQAALLEADARVVAGLQQEHQAEVAQRQRAAEALAAWAQTQQMINAANRPVITNCNQFGNTVNCVSR